MNDDKAVLEEFGSGQPNNGQFRATHILVHSDDAWRLVGIHMSPLAAPLGAQQQTR